MSNLRGPDVITAWGIANAVLLSMLIGYGERPFAIALYASSVFLIELVGAVFWLLYLGKLPLAESVPAPRESRTALLAGLVAAFVGFALVYRPWIAVAAAFPALALVSAYIEAKKRPSEAGGLTRSPADGTSPRRSLVPAAMTVAAIGAVVLAIRRRVAGRSPR